MTKRKDGLWQQQMTVVEAGKKIQRFFYGRTKQEVLKKIAAYKDAAARGRTYLEVSQDWWKEAEPLLAANTLRGYRPAVKRAEDYFGSTRIREIKPSDISFFLRSFIRDHHAADKTARTQLMVIHLCCRWAVGNGDLDANPARDVTVPRGLEKKAREMPSDEDIKRVKESASCTFGMFALWAMYTGCRRGELLALSWEDVDLKERTVTVSKSLYHESNRPHIKEPKTDAGKRVVPLMTKLMEKITPGTGPVFPDPDGGYMTEMHFQKLWKAYTSESGVTCTPHQLRHAYATMLFEAGVSESDAQELLGHAQISTTKDIYTHIREARKKKIRDALLDVDIA